MQDWARLLDRALGRSNRLVSVELKDGTTFDKKYLSGSHVAASASEPCSAKLRCTSCGDCFCINNLSVKQVASYGFGRTLFQHCPKCVLRG